MDHTEMNRKAWDLRTEAHLEGSFYQIEAFLEGAQSLNQIELDLLGDVSGLDILHLQCHFGQDTLSLARMGARATGVDLSPKAIEAARGFRDQLDLDADFICCNVLDLTEKLDHRFDLVFATYGVVGWHQDLHPLMQVASHFIRPGGRLLIVEFHPVMWMFDPDFRNITYPYFNVRTFVEQVGYSYGSEEVFIDVHDVSWNHPISDVQAAILASGLAIETFQEYDFSPYDLFRQGTEIAPGQYAPKDLAGLIPLTYAVTARKPR